jgi:hypothetical protein
MRSPSRCTVIYRTRGDKLSEDMFFEFVFLFIVQALTILSKQAVIWMHPSLVQSLKETCMLDQAHINSYRGTSIDVKAMIPDIFG